MTTNGTTRAFARLGFLGLVALGMTLSGCIIDSSSPRAPTCFDGVRNGFETDIDCGGSTCGGCLAGEFCGSGFDCVSGTCGGGLCLAVCAANTADLTMSWVINENVTGASLTCAQVPADTVDVILDGSRYSFACNAYAGRVNDIPFGTHSAQLQLLDRNVVVSDTGAMSIAIQDCIVYDLNGGPPIPFTVN